MSSSGVIAGHSSEKVENHCPKQYFAHRWTAGLDPALVSTHSGVIFRIFTDIRKALLWEQSKQDRTLKRDP